MKKTAENYYFLPLGRETGGLFDILGLPPDADQATVATSLNKKRQQIEQDFKDERKGVREKLKSGQLSQEEFDKEVEVLTQKRTERDTDINQAKARYDVVEAERRKRGGKRVAAEQDAWMPMYHVADPALAEFWDLLDIPQALPQMELDLLDGINRQWIAGGAVPPGNPPLKLPSEEFTHAKKVDLRLIRQLAMERDLIMLLAADSIWETFGCTNRILWRARLEEWLKQLEELGPFLRLTSPTARIPREFPVLCERRDQTVLRLQVGEAPPDAAMREAPGQKDAAGHIKLLEAMKAALHGGTASKNASSGDGAEPEAGGADIEKLNDDELQALFEVLARAAASKPKQ